MPRYPFSRRFGFMALSAVAAWVLWRWTSGEPAIAVTVLAAKRGPMSEWVRATGHVEPNERIRVSARVTGELAQLTVKEGDTVKKGKLLATISSGTAQQQLIQRTSQAKSLQAQVRLEEARLANALKKERTTQNLLNRGLVSEAELVEAASQTRVARAQLQTAQHRVGQAQAEVVEEQTRMGFAKVVAPVDGTILALEKREGERVRGSEFAEDVVLTLAALDRMHVEVEVAEQDVVHLEVGRPAVVRVRPLDNLEVRGDVAAISAAATIYNRGQLNELTRFKVLVRLNEVPERLRPGMTAEVEIVSRSKENVVLVPFEAVTTRPLPPAPPPVERSVDGGQQFPSTTPPTSPASVVFVVVQGRAVAKPVRTGLASNAAVEITSGIQENDQVITGPFQALSESLQSGSRIQVSSTSGQML